MKLFRSVQLIYRRFGIYSPQPNQSPFNWKNLLVNVNISAASILSAGFFVLKANTVREYGDSFYISITSFINVLICLVQILYIGEISELIENFERFIQRRSHKQHTHALYHELNERIEKVSKIIHFMFIKITIPCAILPFCIMSFVAYFQSPSDSKEDAFRLPFPLIYPFNWKTPFGYAVAILQQFSNGFCYLSVESMITAFFIGSCLMLLTIAKDITNDLKLLNEVEIPEERHKILYEIMDLYIDARQYVRDFSDIYQYTVTIIFLWSLSAIGSSLVVLQNEISKGSIDIAAPSTLVFWAFGCIFLYCEVGERVTTAFEGFDDELLSCDWYLFSFDLQRTLLRIMTYTQKPAVIQGFGNTPCSRFAMNKTVKAGFSYFMTLRQMAN